MSECDVPGQRRAAGRADEPSTDRGQTYALEGFVAASILIGALLVAAQVSAPATLGSQGTDRFAREQRAAEVDTLLTAAVANGTLDETLRYWNNTSDEFHGTTGPYRAGGPPTTFGARLNETLADRGVAFDVTLYHLQNGTDRRGRTELVDQGTPGANAVTATRTVTLFDDQALLDANSTATNVTLTEADGFYATDAGSSDVYNVVEVEVVAWR
jgi:hypothetical protein